MPAANGPPAQPPAILWFRDDLRLADNAALGAAAAVGRPLLACYVLDETGAFPLGGAARWWLGRSLAALAGEISNRGGALVLRRGAAAAVLDALVDETSAAEVHCAQSFEPDGRRVERELGELLRRRGVDLRMHAGALLFDPDTVRTGTGEPFKVFTPFWNACLRRQVAAPRAVPRRLRFVGGNVRSERLEDWRLEPSAPDWASGLRATWTPGEAGARKRLAAFVAGPLAHYARDRDRPAASGTARLSAHLRHGEISVRTAWTAAGSSGSRLGAGGTAFRRELGWREFARHLLWHWPELATEPFRPEFRRFPWRDDSDAFDRWRHGRTGYPLVDAGMRELWQTGWMHNRVRMVAASFLVKHLLLPWTRGAAWFWDTLVDADLANNSVGWQWVAGSGADAAPYFRVFNPWLQSRKFDSHGEYIRRWVPELARLPSAAIHEPASVPEPVLRGAGVELDRDYPRPIVSHPEARQRALAAYAAARRSPASRG